MPTIRIRESLPSLLSGSSVGLELGVAKGVFSHSLLKNKNLRLLYSVDMWRGDRLHTNAEMKVACDRLAVYGDRSVVIKCKFINALNLFPDLSLDFIYIDGYAHTGQDSGQTLKDWFPKLRTGGVFAGHDYHPAYQKTIDEVDKFFDSRLENFELTTEKKYPSWWTIKL